MTLLTASDILDYQDLTYEEVDVPEWGGAVRIKSLTAGEHLKFAQSVGESGAYASALLIVMSVVDEEGRRVFTAENIDAISGKSFRAINRLVEAILTKNNIAARDIEVSEKN